MDATNLPTDRNVNSTTAQHFSDHNTVHGAINDLTRGAGGIQRRNASETTRGFPTTVPLDIFDDRLTGIPPLWYVPGIDVLLSSV